MRIQINKIKSILTNNEIKNMYLCVFFNKNVVSKHITNL